jgi:hypothetical protein
MTKKYIYMEITFFDKGQHCRKIPPDLNGGKYSPHLVVKGQSDYLGIQFFEGENVILGKKVKGTAECLYEGVNYDVLEPNVLFFIMEGGNKIGEGEIIETWVL